MTLLAQDLLLLLIDDATGKFLLDRTRLERALAGAVLVELVLAERVEPTAHAGSARARRIVVRDRRPTGDSLLDESLARLPDKPTRPGPAVERLVKGLQSALLKRLVDAGFVREEHGKALGIFPTRVWPGLRPEHEAAAREQLRAVLVDGRSPDGRTAALIALLTAVDAVPKVVPSTDRRALVARARRVAEGDWAGRAVRDAVDAVHAAIIAATTT